MKPEFHKAMAEALALARSAMGALGHAMNIVAAHKQEQLAEELRQVRDETSHVVSALEIVVRHSEGI